MSKITFKESQGITDKPLSQWIEVGDIVSRGLNLPAYKVLYVTPKNIVHGAVVLENTTVKGITSEIFYLYDSNPESKEYYKLSNGKKEEKKETSYNSINSFSDGSINPFLKYTSPPTESGSKLNIKGDVGTVGVSDNFYKEVPVQKPSKVDHSKDWGTWKQDGNWYSFKETTASPNTGPFNGIITDPHYKIVNDGGDYSSLEEAVKFQCVAKSDIIEFRTIPSNPENLVDQLGIYEVEYYAPKSTSLVSSTWISEISNAFNERNWKLKYVYKVNPFFIMVKPGDLVVKGKDGYINILSQKEFDAIYTVI